MVRYVTIDQCAGRRRRRTCDDGRRRGRRCSRGKIEVVSIGIVGCEIEAVRSTIAIAALTIVIVRDVLVTLIVVDRSRSRCS